MSALARLAADEYRRRKASVDAAVAQRRFDRGEGEKLLRCWLSVALTAGARPADCDALLGYWQEERKLTDVYARYILLEQGPKREVWQVELTRARDAAGSKARASVEDKGWEDRRTLDLSLRHHALDSLAIYLGCPSEFPVEEQKKAAA